MARSVTENNQWDPGEKENDLDDFSDFIRNHEDDSLQHSIDNIRNSILESQRKQIRNDDICLTSLQQDINQLKSKMSRHSLHKMADIQNSNYLIRSELDALQSEINTLNDELCEVLTNDIIEIHIDDVKHLFASGNYKFFSLSDLIDFSSWTDTTSPRSKKSSRIRKGIKKPVITSISNRFDILRDDNNDEIEATQDINDSNTETYDNLSDALCSINLSNISFRSPVMASRDPNEFDELRKTPAYQDKLSRFKANMDSFEAFKEQVEGFPTRLTSIESRLNGQERQMNELKSSLDSRFSNVDDKLDNLCRMIQSNHAIQFNSQPVNQYNPQPISQPVNQWPLQPSSTSQWPSIQQTTYTSSRPLASSAPTPPVSAPTATGARSKQNSAQATSKSGVSTGKEADITPPGKPLDSFKDRARSVNAEECQNIIKSITPVQDLSLEGIPAYNLHYTVRQRAGEGGKFYLYYSNREADTFTYMDLTNPLEFSDQREKITYTVRDRCRRVVLYPFLTHDYEKWAKHQKATGKPMVYSMVKEFMMGFLMMPENVFDGLNIACIFPPAKEPDFGPKTLEVVFGNLADLNVMEEYRPRMMQERMKIPEKTLRPQLKLSVAEEMEARFKKIQELMADLRTPKRDKNGEWKEYGTKLMYDTSTFKDFKILTRDKSLTAG